MEELREWIIKAFEEGVRKGLENVNFVTNGKDPNELLTIEQVHEEFNIGINMVKKMFKDPELPVQKYTKPFKVTRGAMGDYIKVRHDYLCSK